MITITGLSFRIGNKLLVDDLNFSIAKGEMLAILGANGAGKSTFLKMLSGELKPSVGNIRIRGKLLDDYSLHELARQRAILVQQHTLSISFLVHELVMMGRYPHFGNQPLENDKVIVRQVMEDTGILHLANRDYQTLSGGEQQRVHLSRILAQIYDCPEACLFLDEPTNGLDLLYQQQVMELARGLSDKGYTVICILHDINFASTFADQILLLKQGRMVAMGRPEEVINFENLKETFGVSVRLVPMDGYKCPLVVPAAVKI